jgi:hypothetical protein
MKLRGAVFSDDGIYRYVLWRIWDESKPMINFIGLNPSTADAENDDPTMRRCQKFARSWNYGGFYMTNLFGFKATRPSELKKASDPVGIDNNKWLIEIESRVDKVVFAWGINGVFLNRDKEVTGLITQAYYIELTKDGYPKHPLYLKSNQFLKIFNKKFD